MVRRISIQKGVSTMMIGFVIRVYFRSERDIKYLINAVG